MMDRNINVIKKLNYFLATKKIPNIIFHGASGTGKRTIVNKFLSDIYGGDKSKVKNNVMMVNCSHGKGIKFIRDELKFFAKTNIQVNDIMFKSIVLFNADSLTIDAQSALRRCIELFSYNTRFFIVVENKHKLLNPILSRFCDIYVPGFDEDGDSINLHKKNIVDMDNYKRIESLKKHISEFEFENDFQLSKIIDISTKLYENGFYARQLIENLGTLTLRYSDVKLNEDLLTMYFFKLKREFRCEKMLLFYLLEMIYSKKQISSNDCIKNMLLI